MRGHARPVLFVTVERDGHDLVASADDRRIEVNLGPQFPVSQSNDFAAFLFLPIAMRLGQPLYIAGAGDPRTARNAEEMSEVWETWMPDFFQSVTVQFDIDRVTPAGSGSVVLYSGGVDSAYNLLTRKQRGETQSLLTVHGLDYSVSRDAPFADLIAKTLPFASYVSDEWIKIRSDVYRQYNALDIPAGIGHGFALGASLFLYNHRFATPIISADYTSAQEMLVHPWGTNRITNSLFASSTYALQTANSDVPRSEKLLTLTESPVAMESLSFCGEESCRPHNCGRCAKCTRTKAMFLATTGTEPPIFLSKGIDVENLQRWKVWKHKERPFFMDFYQAARAGGHLAKMPWFDDVVAEALDRSTNARFKRFIRSAIGIGKAA